MDVERLKRVELFEDLSDEQLVKLAGREIGVAKRGLRKASVEAAEDASGSFLTNSQVEMLRREAPGLEQKIQSLVEERGF